MKITRQRGTSPTGWVFAILSSFSSLSSSAQLPNVSRSCSPGRALIERGEDAFLHFRELLLLLDRTPQLLTRPARKGDLDGSRCLVKPHRLRIEDGTTRRRDD
ncbi:hypothetical protein QBC34DRAFT_139692 [Podospora aff. communis PSN243]|uniref:Secreted protein n=1 Tax=Podospora aff. communis PSN243 TaxID=3040156 RepID=A0AAV9H5B0_9PEZI|nr:hypothetical protein QBC34DRAFT_139692 [Podospora aff. communis PSN243]